MATKTARTMANLARAVLLRLVFVYHRYNKRHCTQSLSGSIDDPTITSYSHAIPTTLYHASAYLIWLGGFLSTWGYWSWYWCWWPCHRLAIVIRIRRLELQWRCLRINPIANQYLLYGMNFLLITSTQIPQNTLAEAPSSTTTTTTLMPTIMLLKQSATSSSAISALRVNELWPIVIPEMGQQNQHKRHNHLQHRIECSELWSLKLGQKRQASHNNIEHMATTSSTSSADWVNPCGGQYIERHVKPKIENAVHFNRRRRKSKEQRLLRKIWRKLQNVVKNEYKTLKLAAPFIDISDIRIWRGYQEYYDILPKLQLNASISLRRWHRHLQIYVASFTYLRRAQLHGVYDNAMIESATVKELKILKSSARNVLCNVEMALNNTATVMEQTNPRKPSKLFVYKAQTMERKLKFQMQLKPTGSWHESSLSRNHQIDLKFVKYYYLHYLRRMIKNLRFNLRKLSNRKQ